MPNLLSAEFLAELGAINFDAGSIHSFNLETALKAARAFHDLAPLLRELEIARLGATHGEYKYDEMNKTLYGGDDEIIIAERFQFNSDGKFLERAANIAAQIKRKVGG